MIQCPLCQKKFRYFGRIINGTRLVTHLSEYHLLSLEDTFDLIMRFNFDN